MIAKNWMKWIAGSALAALTLVALPAVGQGHVHYTGTTPAGITPVKLTATRHATKLVSHKKHRKHKKLHAKSHAKLHHTLSRHGVSALKKKA